MGISNLFGFFQREPVFPKITLGEGFYPSAQIVADDIGRLARVLNNFREPLALAIHEVIIPSIDQNFQAEGRPPWEPLSSSTVDRRGAAHPILQETGYLRAMATSEDIWTITDDTAVVTGLTAVDYAGYVQGGTSNMPARPFMLIQESDVEAIELVFGAWVDEKIRSVGRFR